METSSSSLKIYPDFASNITLERLHDLELEEEPPVIIRGATCRQHRNIGFFSDESEGYRYSGNIIVSQPLPSFLKRLMRKVNKHLGTIFNGILVNQYIDGSKYIGAHSDDKRGLSNGCVASLSVGATRLFRVRNKITKAIVYEVEHESGDLLVMSGNFQDEFTHEIPKQLRIKKERISLTFRQHSK
jgi:alkylated DNA repair dioxygenase AlkB